MVKCKNLDLGSIVSLKYLHLIYCTPKGALNKIISAYFDLKLLIK